MYNKILNMFGEAGQMMRELEGKKSLFEGFSYFTKEMAKHFGPCPDMYAVSKTISLGPFSSMGQEMAKDLAFSMERKIGDGSTRSLLICEAIVKMSIHSLENGMDLVQLIEEVQSATAFVCSYLKEQSFHYSDLEQVAITASVGNEEIGEIISGSMQSGELLFLEGEQDPEELHGIKIEGGYFNPHFVAHSGCSYFDYEDVDIYLCKKEISSIQKALTFLDKIKKRKNPALILSTHFSKDVMATFLLNHLRGLATLCLVKSSFADKFAGEEIEGNDSTLDGNAVLGKAERVIITDETTIIGSSELEHDKVTLLYLPQEQIPFYRKIKKICELAKKGVVVGGGSVYVHASKELQKKASTGANILAQAILSPISQLFKNGHLDPSILIDEIASSPKRYGCNLISQKIEDLSKSGVVDPLPIATLIIEEAVKKAEEILRADLLILGNRS